MALQQRGRARPSEGDGGVNHALNASRSDSPNSPTVCGTVTEVPPSSLSSGLPSVALIKLKMVWYRELNRYTEGWEATQVVRIAQKFDHFLETYRRPDGSRWGGQDLYNATGGVVTRSYVSNLRKGRIENPGFEKLRAIAKAMGFPPELWFEDAEDLRNVSGGRPSWFVDSVTSSKNSSLCFSSVGDGSYRRALHEYHPPPTSVGSPATEPYLVLHHFTSPLPCRTIQDITT